ncbi:MAG: histidine kinase [Bacteroidota bacterium]
MAVARSRPPYWVLHLAGWGLFALAMMIGRAGEWDIVRIVVTETAFAGLAAIVSLAMWRLYLRLDVRASRPARMAGVVLLASYVGGVAWTLAYRGYLQLVDPALLAALLGGPPVVRTGGPIFDGTVYHTAILLGWSALTLGIQTYAAFQHERERALQAEADAQRARLQALRYQLNPHFLFNALNGVSTLVAEGHAREATAMLARLSDFLRLTLDEDAAAEVPLAAEVEFVRRYLDIERARFGDRLRTRFDVADEVLSAEVPALILQPLVENAVKHAVSPREEGARITIAARRDGAELVLDVADDGPGLGVSDADGLGVGLANVRDRLRQRGGGALELSELAGGGLRVRLRLPFRTAPAVRDPLAVVASAPEAALT